MFCAGKRQLFFFAGRLLAQSLATSRDKSEKLSRSQRSSREMGWRCWGHPRIYYINGVDLTQTLIGVRICNNDHFYSASETFEWPGIDHANPLHRSRYQVGEYIWSRSLKIRFHSCQVKDKDKRCKKIINQVKHKKITRLIILSDKESGPQANQIVHQAFGFHLAKGKSSTYSKG